MRRLLDLFRRLYGSGPLHLIGLVASFALAGYAAMTLIEQRTVAVAVWFIGAAVLHDLVLLPAYALLDRVASLRRTPRPAPSNAVNYVRVPAGISLILLLVYLPTIAKLSDRYTPTTGLTASGEFARWLAVTGALFAISGALFVVRLGRQRTGR